MNHGFSWSTTKRSHVVHNAGINHLRMQLLLNSFFRVPSDQLVRCQLRLKEQSGEAASHAGSAMGSITDQLSEAKGDIDGGYHATALVRLNAITIALHAIPSLFLGLSAIDSSQEKDYTCRDSPYSCFAVQCHAHRNIRAPSHVGKCTPLHPHR